MRTHCCHVTMTDHLKASLASEDDGGTVLQTGIRCTRGGAEVGDGDFSLGVDDGSTGGPTNVLALKAYHKMHLFLFCFVFALSTLRATHTTGGPLSGSKQTVAPEGHLTPGMGLRGWQMLM